MEADEAAGQLNVAPCAVRAASANRSTASVVARKAMHGLHAWNPVPTQAGSRRQHDAPPLARATPTATNMAVYCAWHLICTMMSVAPSARIGAWLVGRHEVQARCVPMHAANSAAGSHDAALRPASGQSGWHGGAGPAHVQLAGCAAVAHANERAEAAASHATPHSDVATAAASKKLLPSDSCPLAARRVSCPGGPSRASTL